jgi:hypothetical protein
MAEPGHPAVAAWLARSLALAGDPEEGVAVLADLPERARACHIMGIEALFRATLGQRERANALCEALEIRVDQGGPYGAAARLALGQCDRAVALLERLLSERSGIMVFSGVDDLLGGLRAEPRTAAVLERLGVPMG